MRGVGNWRHQQHAARWQLLHLLVSMHQSPAIRYRSHPLNGFPTRIVTPNAAVMREPYAIHSLRTVPGPRSIDGRCTAARTLPSLVLWRVRLGTRSGRIRQTGEMVTPGSGNSYFCYRAYAVQSTWAAKGPVGGAQHTAHDRNGDLLIPADPFGHAYLGSVSTESYTILTKGPRRKALMCLFLERDITSSPGST
ncbi:hypothetical protein L227DRAFT_15774 [Lentinus tigrinus ALCF2SS1-6]|uniref:Uncharacterized protein n=1 Tax=Lentinus tigrinus ALCF2SS1-6 TaxID=1328759 RepID=A0A5C2SUK4_9APHY|nr:hypothetical protein L227DRAFT_15774 [Lentinus tigrinus ALCF2SS1-6]